MPDDRCNPKGAPPRVDRVPKSTVQAAPFVPSAPSRNIPPVVYGCNGLSEDPASDPRCTPLSTPPPIQENP
jgi:hypothetical protein